MFTLSLRGCNLCCNMTLLNISPALPQRHSRARAADHLRACSASGIKHRAPGLGALQLRELVVERHRSEAHPEASAEVATRHRDHAREERGVTPYLLVQQVGSAQEHGVA